MYYAYIYACIFVYMCINVYMYMCLGVCMTMHIYVLNMSIICANINSSF